MSHASLRALLSVVAAIVFFPLPHLYAQTPPDYMCTIVDLAEARDDGRIGSTGWTDRVADELVGTSFLVDRQSGRMTGSVLRNDNAFGTPQIVDHGSSEQAYKVVTVYQPRATLDYLRVEEHVDGPVKPFLFLNGRQLVTGTCIHVF